MKPLKKILFIIAIIITFRSYSQATAQIVPQPNQIEVFENGTFTVSENTSIKKSDDSKTISKVLKTLFKEEFNIDVKIVSAKKSNQIQFAQDGSMAKEAYQLEVTTNEIKITAAGYSGWFYGVQSLDQLISSSKKKTRRFWGMPYLNTPTRLLRPSTIICWAYEMFLVVSSMLNK